MSTSKFVDLLRLRESIGKMQINAVAGLLFLLAFPVAPQMFAAFIFFLFYQFFSLTYGYTVNSLADIAADKKIGKGVKFTMKEFSIAVAASGLASLLFPLLFNPAAAIVAVASFACSTAYSLGPLRLKERGFLGMVAAALPQSALPFLFLASLASFNSIAAFFAVWLFLRQLLSEITHHIKDYSNDVSTSTRSFAVVFGTANANRLLIVFFLLFSAATIFPAIAFGTYGLFAAIVLSFFSLHTIADIFRI